MILIITTKEKNHKTGIADLIVSHGINLKDDSFVILPNLSPREIGAKFDFEIGEYVLE